MGDRNEKMTECQKDHTATGDSGQLVRAGAQSVQHESTAQSTQNASEVYEITMPLETLRLLGLNEAHILNLPRAEGEVGQMSVTVRDRSQGGRIVRPPLVWNHPLERYVYTYNVENVQQVPQLVEFVKQVRVPHLNYHGIRIMPGDEPFLRKIYGMKEQPEAVETRVEHSPTTNEVN